MQSTSLYPEGVVKKKGGVMVVPGGYAGGDSPGDMIKLPTTVGSGSTERQYETAPLTVTTVTGSHLSNDEDQEVAPPNEPVSSELADAEAALLSAQAMLAAARELETTREVTEIDELLAAPAAVVIEAVVTQDTNPVVDPVGTGVDASDYNDPGAPLMPTVGADAAKQDLSLLPVRITHSESGFSFISEWDVAIVSEPMDGVTTIALGVKPENGVTLREGEYTLEIEGDSYVVYFGNQGFQYVLKYYIFIVQ